ncbi:HD domain-containing protein [Amycolatopsis panacis]|nr:HD domain-containing protein [Amycolatopsis panacis]
MQLTPWAFGLAEKLLATELPRRWAHVRGTARHANRIGLLILDGDEQDLLVAAAVSHDIGYARSLVRYGFHPLDGATFVARVGAPDRLTRLVANHSASAFAAGIRGMSEEMSRFPDESTPVRDALWYCDCVTDPNGNPIAFEARMAEIRRRHGLDSVNVRALDAGGLAARTDAVRRCEQRMRAAARRQPAQARPCQGPARANRAGPWQRTRSEPPAGNSPCGAPAGAPGDPA